MKRVLAAVLASACGRVEFARLPDSAVAREDSPARDSFVASDLLLHYAFDTLNPRLDTAQVPHPGACIECPTIAAGRVGAGAASFDGTQCLDLPGSRDLQPATFTYAAWARARSAHHGTIFGRAFDGAGAVGNSYELWMEPTPAVWNLSAHANRIVEPATIGTWHHFAGSYDGTELLAYLDGVILNRVPTSPEGFTPDDLTIGCDLNLGALVQRFDGEIDDVRLYGRALLPAEIAALAAM